MERMMAQSTAVAPSAAAGSKTERLLAELRSAPLFRQLVPMEAGIGWPIPLRREGKVYLTLPFFGFGVARSEGKRIELHPPFASITLNWSTGRPVKYVSFAFERPWPQTPGTEPVGVFPHDAVRGLSVAAYSEKRSALLAMYDELFESLAGQSTLSMEWNARFSAALRMLVEPSLEPYYRALGEKFFERFLPEPAAT